MRVLKVPLRIVFYMEEDRWLARCLEFDLLGDGDTQSEAIECLLDAIQMQVEYSVEHGSPGNLFQPAEGKYQQMFCAGRPVATGEVELKFDSVEIEGIDAREFIDDGHLQPS